MRPAPLASCLLLVTISERRMTENRNTRETLSLDLSRRELIQAVAALATAALSCPRDLRAGSSESEALIGAEERFPYFQSIPVSYRHVKMQDTFWAPRQRTTREVTVPWIAKAHDLAGGLEAFRAQPQSYRAD